MGVLDDMAKNASKAADEAIADQKAKLEAKKAQEQTKLAAHAKAEAAAELEADKQQ